MFKARSRNLHVFPGQSPEIDRMLRFRDWLRNYAADRHRDAETKRNLAQQEWEHVQSYADVKTGTIEEILGRAVS